MLYGLNDIELDELHKVFAASLHIEQAILYGSRAKGNYKPFSDVDIVLVGDNLSRSDLIALNMEIDDLLMPYKFDIILFHTIKTPELIDHINRRGVVIYRRDN